MEQKNFALISHKNNKYFSISLFLGYVKSKVHVHVFPRSIDTISRSDVLFFCSTTLRLKGWLPISFRDYESNVHHFSYSDTFQVLWFKNVSMRINGGCYSCDSKAYKNIIYTSSGCLNVLRSQ